MHCSHDWPLPSTLCSKCITVHGLRAGPFGCIESCACSYNTGHYFCSVLYSTVFHSTALNYNVLNWTHNIQCTIMVCNSLMWCSNKITTQHYFTQYWISFYRSNLVQVPLWFVTTEKKVKCNQWKEGPVMLYLVLINPGLYGIIGSLPIRSL